MPIPSCAVRSEAVPWHLLWVSPARTWGAGSCGADGASRPFHLPLLTGKAAPRGSRLAGILRPAVSGDSASQGSVAPGLCVLSGWALRGGGGWEWSTTQERLEPGFHSGESWVLPAPTTVTWKTMSQLVYWPSLLAQTHKPCLTSWFSQLLLHLLQGVLHGQRGGPVVPDVLWGRGQRCHHCCLSLLRPWVLEAAPVPSGSRTGGQEKRWDAM